jgi:nitroreductase
MESFESLAAGRRSIRRYLAQPVDMDSISECIKTAGMAPSGCNSQCWHFVVTANKKIISDIAAIVEKKQLEIMNDLHMAVDDNYRESRKKLLTFFVNAPVCIAVFMTRLEYYDQLMKNALNDAGYSYSQMMDFYGNPDLLSVGAAIENLLLALHEKGLGACWMNDPVIAARELAVLLRGNSDERLISLIPVGHPSYRPRPRNQKPVSEIMTVLE